MLLFSVAIMVIAAHAAVDSFIAPEPGTGWGDHLLRGSPPSPCSSSRRSPTPRPRRTPTVLIARTRERPARERPPLSIARTRARARPPQGRTPAPV